MKTILFILVVAACGSRGYAQQGVGAWFNARQLTSSYLNIQGEVALIRETSHAIGDDNEPIGYEEISETNFDRSGNITRELKYTNFEQLYSYDSLGRLASYETKDSKTTFTYSGDSAVAFRTSSEGEIPGYDNIYILDKYGNVIEIYGYNSAELIYEHHFSMKYNEQHQCIEQKIFLFGGKTITYEYDQHGNCISEIESTDGNTTEIICTYDKYGNVLEKKFLDSDGGWYMGYTNQYTYDLQGNWIENVYTFMSMDEKQVSVVTRKVTYF